jgi:DNA-binding MarR family transcriptional regulator
VVRGKSLKDGRKQTIDLLPAGVLVLNDAKKAVQDHENWLKSRFTQKEIEKLIEMLTRIHE